MLKEPTMENNSLNHEKEIKTENKNEERRNSKNKLIDFLVDNYITDDGSFDHHERLLYRQKEIDASSVRKDYGVFNSHIDEDVEIIEMIVEKINAEKTALRKVTLIRLARDITKEIIRNDDADFFESVRCFNNCLREIADGDDNFLVSSYAKNILYDSIDDELWWDESEHDYELHSDRFLKTRKDISKFHDETWNNFDLTFSKSMITSIAYESQDWGYKVSADSAQLEKSFKTVDGDEHDEDFSYGDYITADLSPDAVGVFSKYGNLVGWFSMDSAVDKIYQSGHGFDYFAEDDRKHRFGKDEIDIAVKSIVAEREENDRYLNSFVKNLPPGAKFTLEQNYDFLDINLKETLGLADEINFSDKSDLALFKIMLSVNVRSDIIDKIGFDLSRLDLKTQYHFLSLIKTKSFDELNVVVDFLNESGDESAKVSRIKSFLSLELDPTMSNKILSIGENTKNNPELADKIFAKYAEIVGDAYEIENRVRDEFDKKDINGDELATISRSLLFKGKSILEEYADKLAIDSEVDEQQILNDLDSCKADLLLTASINKEMYRQGGRPEDIKGVTFDVDTIAGITNNGEIMKVVDQVVNSTLEGNPYISGTNIKSLISKYATEASPLELEKAQEIIEMLNIYEKNFRGKPDEMKNIIIDGFKQRLQEGSNDTTIYSYKKDGHLMAFVRIDKMEDGREYLGSFNVQKNIQDSAIGSALMNTVLKERGEDTIIEADCSFLDDIGRYYIEKCGFVAKSSYDFKGEPSLSIERKKGNYYYKDYSQDDLVQEYEKNFSENKISSNEKYFILKFPKNSPEKITTTEKFINSGDCVVTRYFTKKEDKKEYDYLALERVG